MFQVIYLCTANPWNPVWRDDIETDDWATAVTRCNLIRASGRHACVMCSSGQVMYAAS